ncbi:hypothetical protein M433DRAFT_59630 [Acidomyces richmondensis BFW]|nr:MAG: hypothetical protein FE78DRAFT_155468 [Acidomyces sp. 'richmondensis']KYG49190.1 hypothetical protein M433DRAFT_59630 [Acidomyces richmondensis BFW]
MPSGSLTNEEQVGNSTLGTLCNNHYPLWLGNSQRAPWGNCTVYNCDASNMSTIPETNVTRNYEFSISRGQIYADGVLREVILINDQFPGPLIEANWGDWIQVTVHNNIKDPMEGTSLHWHGQTQKGTPWEDGVPNAGQCPIAPGHSFTYNYRALLHGSSWYHAHYSAQFSAGIAGPMIVHGPSSLPYDIDVGPVMLSDWYHIPYFALVADAVGTNLSLVPPTSDSNLINGRGRFNCSDPSFDKNNQILASNDQDNITWTCVDNAPLSAFRFESKKTHRLRLINHGANGVQKFTIDNHQMTVIAVDYVPIQPYTTDIVTLGVGQRSDVLVIANDDPTTSVWMRTSAPGGEACGGSDYPEVLAAIYYEEANTSLEPTTVSSANTNATACVNDPLTSTVPAYSITPSNGSFVQDIGLHLVVNETGHFVFEINGQGFHADFNVPILAQAQAGNFTFAPEWNVYNFKQNTSLILNITNNMPLAHPFHLHGHNFYVLNVNGPVDYSNSAANGPHGPVFANGSTWDGAVINPANPTRRDGIIIPPYGFAALQLELDNPGVWPFHCHIAWHLSGGQGMNILYNAAGIPEIPSGFIEESCQNWDYYSTTNIVDQIDSGA